MLFIRYHFYDSTIQSGIINGTENNTSVHYFSEEIVHIHKISIDPKLTQNAFEHDCLINWFLIRIKLYIPNVSHNTKYS